jgi:hypothetical protein
MKLLHQIVLLLIVGFLIESCSSSPIKNIPSKKEEPVVIANDSLAYEIIIMDIGFNTFLNTIAQPENYYSQSYLENKNRIFVTNWNIRANSPSQFNSNIYENTIDYQPNIDYGYDVNYKLFNYFLFAQRKYKMSLGAGFPGRIR